MSVTQNRVSFIKKGGDVGGGQKWESLLNHVSVSGAVGNHLSQEQPRLSRLYMCV